MINPKDTDTVGITAIASYIPKGILTAEEMSHKSGIPCEVLKDKIGIHEKHIANDKETPSFMGAAAAQSVLANTGLAAKDIDIILYAAGGFYDYHLWSPASKIQSIIGAKNASCFEIRNGCNAGNLGLHICKRLLLNSPHQHALVICSEGLSKTINYTDQNTSSLFIVGDGAVAALLSKNDQHNKILNYASMTEGSLSDEIKVLGGGTVNFSDQKWYDNSLNYAHIQDPIHLAHIFDKIYLQSLTEIGYDTTNINYLFTNQVKRSLSDSILSALNLREEQTIKTLKNYGHMGTVDTLFCLELALNKGMIKKDDLVLLASSAAGFTWASLVIHY